jgi:LDH2 family malate/lactate/ureidoglycolate dehydrogenase
VTPTNTGQAILVINLEAFGEVSIFKSAVDTLVQDIRASERLPGVDRIWLPGEQSHARRQAYGENGIPVAGALAKELAVLAKELGVEPMQIN